jgi:tetratricopeptide (TPR) repeat protein
MKAKLVICVALIVGTATVYWPVHRYGFVNYDDVDYVLENPHVHAGLTLAAVKWAFTSSVLSNWHPLTWLSYMMDVQLFGINAGWHHVMNVVFHIANAILLFLVLALMTEEPWPSAFVAALFAWHPLHVESVAWIAERKDVLSTFFDLFAMLAYVFYVKSRQRRFLLLSVLAFALALMSKPMVVTLPFVLLLLDYWPLKRISESGVRNLSLVVEKVPFFVLSAASSLVTFAVVRSDGMVVSLNSLPVRLRLVNSLFGYARYLQKTFLPTRLAVIYPIEWKFSWEDAVALTAFVFISIVAACWMRRRPWFLVSWLWFLGTLVPVIGFVQAGRQGMADRYTYLPLVGIFIILAWGGAEIAATSQLASRIVTCSAVAVLGAALLLTSMQIRPWADSQTLFEHAIAVTNDNYVAHGILGRFLASRGQYEQAQAHFEEALRIFPDLPDSRVTLAMTHYNFGNALMKNGHIDEAIGHYGEAAQLDPQFAEAQNNWGYALIAQGRFLEAVQHYEAALRIKPDLQEARLNVARLHQQLGDAH